MAEEYGKAQFDFDSEPDRDDILNFKAGSIIKILEKGEPGGWTKGELNGCQGIFPTDFVELGSGPPDASTASMGLAVGLFDYEAAAEDELTIKVGDHVQISTIEGAWWHGTIDGRSGIFPANYVELKSAPGATAAPAEEAQAAFPADPFANTAAVAAPSSGGFNPFDTSPAPAPAASDPFSNPFAQPASLNPFGAAQVAPVQKQQQQQVHQQQQEQYQQAQYKQQEQQQHHAMRQYQSANVDMSSFAAQHLKDRSPSFSRASIGVKNRRESISGSAANMGKQYTWRHPVFMDLMADPFMTPQSPQEQQLQSAKPSGPGAAAAQGPGKNAMVTLSLSLQFVHKALQHCIKMPSGPLQQQPPQTITALQSIADALMTAIELGVMLPMLASGVSPTAPEHERFKQFLSKLTRQASDLPMNGVMLLPGGWSRPADSQHMPGTFIIFYVLQRKADSYTLSVVNTNSSPGAGLDYHASRSEVPSAKVKKCLGIPVRDIPLYKLKDSTFWFLLYRPLHICNEYNSPDMVYERLLPYLNSRPLMANITDDASGVDYCGDFRTVPRAGDASGGKCIMEAVRTALRMSGLTVPQAKHVGVCVRHALVSLCINDLKQGNGMGGNMYLNATEAGVLNTAASQLQLAASKHAKLALNGGAGGTTCTSKDLQAIGTAGEQLKEAVRAGRGGPHWYPPELALPAFDKMGASPELQGAACHPLFGRLRRDTTVEHLAGVAPPPRILLPVELTLVPDAVSSFNDVTNAMRHCVHVCTLLGNQSTLIKNTHCLRVSLIQNLFTSVIPLPLPIGHPHRDQCFWAGTAAGDTMRYETQADLLRLIHMLSRHFAASSLSLKVTRSFDATRLLTMSCMAALADVVMRVQACDIPSQLALHYAGMAGGQWSPECEQTLAPFGFEVAHFIEESEYLRFNNPEHAVTLTAVLDYLTSVKRGLKDDHILFRFEQGTRFGQGECNLMEQLCLQMAFPRATASDSSKAAHPMYMSGEDPLILDNYPELGFLRDIIFLFKALMAPTSDALPDLKPWKATDAVLRWKFSRDDEDDPKEKAPPGTVEPLRSSGKFDVIGFGKSLQGATGYYKKNKGEGVGSKVRNFLGLGSKPRAPPSGGDPSNLVGQRVDTEDDVLHIRHLPDFGGRLRSRDCEMMLQYLTVPYLRIPLVMRFFSQPVRINALQVDELQNVLDSCLFEPGVWQQPPDASLDVNTEGDHATNARERNVPTAVPVTGKAAVTREHTATPCGLLFNELQKSPYVLVRAIEEMLARARHRPVHECECAADPVHRAAGRES
jgi:hypothetical protein